MYSFRTTLFCEVFTFANFARTLYSLNQISAKWMELYYYEFKTEIFWNLELPNLVLAEVLASSNLKNKVAVSVSST